MLGTKARSALLGGLLLAAASFPLLPSGAEATTLPGPLYKLSSAPTVYVEQGGALHAVASPAMLFDLGYSWNDMTVVTRLPAPVGTPINLLQPHGSPKVYLYQNGQLHWIETSAIFKQNGFQWANVYPVNSLPAALGTPITGPITSNVPPGGFNSQSAFPDIPAGKTKTLTIDALNSNGSIDTAYQGTLTVSNPTNNLMFQNSPGSYVAGPFSVDFVHGIGTVTVKAGTTTGTAHLQFASNLLSLSILPDTSNQVGWRVFTAAKIPVTSVNPLTTVPANLLIEPVDAAGHIVSGTLADEVSLRVISSSPAIRNLPFSASNPTVAILYAGSQGIPYTFNGQAFGVNIGASAAYPLTFSVVPRPAATVKVTAVQGPASSPAPTLSNPVSNNGQIQVVTGIQANQTYHLQLQLETASQQPILGLPTLYGSKAYPILPSTNQSPSFSVSTNGRATPSSLEWDYLGVNHVYLTYRTGSANNVPDLLSLWGTLADYGNQPGSFAPTPIVELVTNSF